MVSSLFEYLSNVPNAGANPPLATEVILFLLKAVAHDACSASRNTQRSYLFVQQARDACKVIIDLVNKAERDGDWDSYDKFTIMIDPLEDLLFQIAGVMETESLLYLPDRGGISQRMKSLDTWKDNREKLDFALRRLQEQPFEPSNVSSEDMTWAGKHDDIALFRALFTKINVDPSSTDQSIAELISHIQDVRAALTEIETYLLNGVGSEDATVISIQFAMLVYGVVDVALSSPDATVKQHLRGYNVWLKAKNVANSLVSYFRKDRSALFSNVETKWKEFKSFLENLSAAFPTGVDKLLEYAGQVTRPYYSQMVAMVAQCRTLLDHVRSPEGNNANVNAFDKSIAAAIKALDAASRTSKKCIPLDPKTVGSLRTKEADDSFTTAEQEIEFCFKAYDLTHQWADHKQNMAKAREIDNDHLNRLVQRLNTRKIDNPGGLNQINVKVKRHNATNASAQTTDKTYKVESRTRLAAIFRLVASDLVPADRPRLLSHAQFAVQKPVNNQLKWVFVPMDLEVDNLPASLQGHVVYLFYNGIPAGV